MIELREITRDDVCRFCALHVAPDQMDLVSPNAVTLAEAAYEPDPWIRGIWQGGAPVGLIAMKTPKSYPADEDIIIARDAAYIWRLMVGQGMQGRGIGSAAIEAAVDQARAWGFDAVTLTAADAPNSAIPFYERHGFRRTGRVLWEGEPEMRRALAC